MSSSPGVLMPAHSSAPRTTGASVALVDERGSARAVLAPCLLFHPLQTGVVVGKLVQMRECDLAGHELIVTGHVRCHVLQPVLELDIHPHPKLLYVERRRRPIDPEPLADEPGFVR